MNRSVALAAPIPAREHRPAAPGRNLGLDLVRVTEAAALAAGRWMGRSDKNACDAAAVEAMRLVLGDVDLLLGIGGTPEGVISACAVRALGGAMLGQLAPQKPGEGDAIQAAGICLDRIWTERDLVDSEDVFFAATGITDGVLLSGARYSSDGAATESFVIRGRSGTRRIVSAQHRLGKLMAISPIEY